MTERIKRMRDFIVGKKHLSYRQESNQKLLDDFTKKLGKKGLSDIRRASERLAWVLKNEKPVILDDDRIVLMRTIKKIPEIFTNEEWKEIREHHYIHELGKVCNISSNFDYTIKKGLYSRRKEVIVFRERCKKVGNKKGVEFLDSVIKSIDQVEKLIKRYRTQALKIGKTDVARVLERVPMYGARTFYEALQSFRILHFTLWCSGNYHNTIGRFDQYMWPYLKGDLESGILTEDEAFEILEEFFLTFNRDSDLYPGMQQGDNGQSLVLGGVDENGNDSYNRLSELCLVASLELKLIDPKINLRVDKNTPIKRYELGTLLTKQGLGFPQYSNDDIVIPGLLSKSYDLNDARNYVVAACWEFIIPGYGMDIPNIDALSFTKVVTDVMNNYLVESKTFYELMLHVRSAIQIEIDDKIAKLSNIYMEPSPFQSLLMNGCMESARDISMGAKYNNYGFHGTGLATAADSLAALKLYVYDKKEIKPDEIINAVKNNFADYEELWKKVKYESPKMGNDDDYVDQIAIELMEMFSDALMNLKNERGGNFRPGSGSAMYYLWHAKDIGASADGRKKGEPLSANYSPSLNTKLKGPISIIKSFSKPDLKKIMNGGPLTMEIHDTVFSNSESIRKTAMLVKSYMDLGGLQLQINAVNKDTLLDAQKNPDQYKNLIVRVWGWSGYFVELDKEYQDHIIQRIELQV